MYLRTTQRHNRDGSTVRYLQLAQNRRVGGVTRAQVLVNLGREDRVDREALARLAASLDRYLDAGAPAARRGASPDVWLGGARSCGAVWLLEQLWRELGVDVTVRRVLGRRLSNRAERALFALVAHAALAADEPSVARWLALDVCIADLPTLDDGVVSRVRELLLRADQGSRLQAAVFLGVADRLRLDTGLVFTTHLPAASADTAARMPRGPGERGDAGPLVQPLPEAHLAVVAEGTPVGVWACTASRVDRCHHPPALEHAGTRLITIRDDDLRGHDSPDAHGQVSPLWLTALSPAASDRRVAVALARPGRYRDVEPDLRVKEVRLVDDPGARWIVCHDPTEAERRRGRGVRPHPDERRAGKYVLRTNVVDVPAADLAVGHRRTVAARRTFLELGGCRSGAGSKSPPEQSDARVTLRGLALLLVRVAERRSGLAWRQVARELARVHAVTTSERHGTVVRTTALTRQQAALLHACGVAAPPAVIRGPRARAEASCPAPPGPAG